MTLNISSNQIEVKNAIGTTKFNGDDKLMYLRHVQSGNMPRVPDVLTPPSNAVGLNIFQQPSWGVEAALTTTIDPAKDIIELSASLTNVSNAALVPGYNGAYIPIQAPVPVDVIQDPGWPERHTFTYLNGGVGLSKVVFNLTYGAGELVAQNTTSNTYKDYHSKIFINNPNPGYGPTGMASTIVEVDWELKIWRYQN